MSSPIDPDFAKRLRMELGDGFGVVAELRLKLHADGALSISGPLSDAGLCQRLLEAARDAIARHNREDILVVPAKDLSMNPGNAR